MKIKASSLPQVVTAMAILGIVVAITMASFGNIFQHTTPLVYKQLSSAIDSEINKTWDLKTAKDDVIEYENFRIETEFSPHVSIANLRVGYFTGFVGKSKEPVIEKKILIKIIEGKH